MKKIILLFATFITTSVIGQNVWQSCNLGLSGTVTAFAAGPNNKLYLTGYDENTSNILYPILYSTSNNGSSWSPVSLGSMPIDHPFSIIFSGTTLLMCGHDGTNSYIYSSSNYGASWTVSNVGINSQHWLMDFAVSSNGDVYLLGVDLSTNMPKLYTSSNAGGYWSEIYMNGFSSNGIMPYAISFDQNDKLYMAGYNSFFTNLAYTSTDYGYNFTQSNNGIPAGCYVTDLVKGPGQSMYGFGFYYSTSFYVFSPRIYLSINGGSSWSVLSPSGLGNLKIGSRGGLHNGFLYFDGTDTYDYDLVFKSALPTAPLVSTSGVTDILDISAVCGGSVTSTEQIISRGLCWNTTGTPTITDPKVNTSAVTGSFTLNLTSLSPNTTYYVRAFASNFVGITYGNEQTFTTLDFSGVKSFEKESALEIYPIPSSDFVYLDWNASGASKEYSIYDVTGKVVLTSKLKQGENKIDINALPAGVYYLSVEGYQNSKILKQ